MYIYILFCIAFSPWNAWNRASVQRKAACSKMYYEQSPCRSQVPRPKPFGWRGVVALFTLGSSLQQWGMSQTWVVETALTESRLKLLILILSCCKKKQILSRSFVFFWQERFARCKGYFRFSALQVRFWHVLAKKMCLNKSTTPVTGKVITWRCLGRNFDF